MRYETAGVQCCCYCKAIQNEILLYRKQGETAAPPSRALLEMYTENTRMYQHDSESSVVGELQPEKDCTKRGSVRRLREG